METGDNENVTRAFLPLIFLIQKLCQSIQN